MVKSTKVPVLRFPDFKGVWAETAGGKLFDNRRARGVEGLPIYSVTLTKGLVPRDSLDRRFEGDAATGVNLRAKPGDLVYNMMRMWQGAVGRADVDCMVSPAYVVLSPKNGTDTVYFNYCLQRARSVYNLWAYSYGLTSDRLRLYFQDFGRIKFHIPSRPEQQKIATFLGTVEDKIKALRRKRELLQSYKRGVMQGIFSQEVRFKADDGAEFPDWERKRFGAVFSFVRTNNLSRDQLTAEPQQIQNIHYGDIHTRYKAQFYQNKELVPFVKNSTKWEISDEEYCRPGDLIIADASEDYFDIGKSVEIIKVKEQSLVSGLHTYIARPNNNDFVLGFPGYIMQTKEMRRQVMKIAQGISVLGISKPNLSKLPLWKPHPDEQQKIADFLSTIDTKIDAVAAQIEKMATFKKGLLQQMFV